MDTSKASRQLGSPALGQLFDDLLPMARRARNRDANASKRFVTRQQPQRIQPFTERWRMIIEGRVRVGTVPVAIGVPWDLGCVAGFATWTAQCKFRWRGRDIAELCLV